MRADRSVLVFFLLQSNHISLRCVRALEKIKRFQRINEDSPLGGAIHTGRFPGPGLADEAQHREGVLKAEPGGALLSHLPPNTLLTW